MGGNESSSKYGGMVIQTDQQYYISGSQITGRIYVQIHEPYPARKLKLQIKGKEKCRWYQERRETVHYGGHTHHITHYDRHDIEDNVFYYEAVIYEFYQGSINPGQYCFPFSFYLPKECPSSAYFTGSQSAKAYIKYTCKGTFEAANGSNIDDIKYELPFMVRQIKMEVNANLQAFGEEKIDKCCCCCAAGKATVGALFEKNAYTTNEIAHALVNINNSESKCEVKQITMKLKQHVNLNTGGHKYHFVDTVCKEHYPGISAGEHAENKPLEINLSKSHQSFKLDEDDEHLNAEELKIAEFLQPTTNGRWVNIQYEIEIGLKMGGTCCSYSKNPVCSISMFLQPPVIASVAPQAPADWKPTVYKERNFEVPNQVYVPYDPNAVQAPVVFDYGQNAKKKHDSSDEPVSQ